MSFSTNQIISIDNNRLVFHKDKLDSVLAQVVTNKVSVLTINGSLRSGKSFLLNMLIKFMFPDKSFTSFNWTHGSSIGTVGMWVLDTPIKITDTDHSLIIIDTQGIYDTSLDMKTTTTLFALSTLISSYQIYNLDKRLQENYMHHLEFFSEYANIVNRMKGGVNTAPFQHLNFLVRDWQCFTTNNLDKSLTEAEEYFHEFMDEKNKSKEMVKTRENIKKTYKKISCTLLPYPGGEVIKEEFDFDRIDERFKEHAYNYFRDIIANLKPKTVFDRAIKPNQLSGYIKSYLTCLNDKMPNAETILEMQIQLQHSALISDMIDRYNVRMNKAVVDNVSKSTLFEIHCKTSDIICDEFKRSTEWGSAQQIAESIIYLQKRMDDIFIQYDKINDGQKSKWVNKLMVWGILVVLKNATQMVASKWLLNTGWGVIWQTIVWTTGVGLYAYSGYLIIAGFTLIGIDLIDIGARLCQIN